MTQRPKFRAASEICADCSAPGPEWSSINRGVLICDECCSVHRSLGRHVSQVRHLRLAPWNPSLLAMVRNLVNNGANLIWEHSLSDPGQMKSGIRKPNPKDAVHPVKYNFIKAKYEMLSFVHQLPISDDLSITNLSKQLYSASRTGNLETSLRLISYGAQTNFFHTDMGNSPLHAAAKAGQATQVELLIVNGADPSALDSNGKTAAEVAMEEGHTEIGYRIIEHMYELTDRLTFYLCGRRPDHKNSINYFIPALADRGLETTPFAQEARLKLESLTDRLFEELASDVYDEVDRRENDAVWLATQHHRKFVSDHTTVPFLPVNPAFTATRNQGRQKLARFTGPEFTTLIIDILNDARRREMASCGKSTAGIVESKTDHDYDEPEHEYDEVGIDDDVLKELSKMGENHTNMMKGTSKSGSIDKEPGSTSSDGTDGRYVSIEEYNGLKKQYNDAEERASHFQKLNDTLNQEVNLLRSMVQKLMQENASLRTQVNQAETDRDNVEKQMIEMQGKLNEMVMSSKPEDTDSDHVRIDSISPHPNPGVFSSFIDESTTPPLANSSDTKIQNPYDNISYIDSTPSTPYAKPNKQGASRKDRSTLSSSTSQRSNGHNYSPQDYPESSEDSTAFITEDETPQSPQAEDLPTQESIVEATEQITKKIQELLLAAQSAQHTRYIPCASNISTAVNDMANLFPKHPKAENVRSALRLMITSAARLQVECRSSVLPDRTIDAAMLTQQVIQCAYDIAKAAKQLVTTYNQD
ncbi:ARF GTPase-activating protein GIT2-like [Rhopilema esculentum]|uniref:ARF GTPase-activating protein GIT2-like n=1 Tax=Rhopilema esculentum TaxID=499914 RepID=UPI0031D22AA0